jgi:uncharacterized membrane protein
MAIQIALALTLTTDKDLKCVSHKVVNTVLVYVMTKAWEERSVISPASANLQYIRKNEKGQYCTKLMERVVVSKLKRLCIHFLA